MAKHEIDSDLLLKIIYDINNKIKTLNSYEEELGIHRSSIKRRIKGFGYAFNKEEGKWLPIDKQAPHDVKTTINNTSKKIPSKQIEPTKKEINKDIKTNTRDAGSVVAPVGRPKRNGEFERFNIELPIKLKKALKRKALEEDTTATDIIIKLLEDNIENKYR